ncbi:ATP-grasp domain-containing protein [Rhizobium laguerreae]|uniref:D-alanine--D-alanine ligase family protein n=1 Tax=Rhizobium laguerreae TaxID=1076926 RepID=UPI001C905BB5|nr:ATP-grasp domain-containing protein [Rhizobium laguerreae]MBY3327470.1 ATP-grasp domain-containing protein [Rhizobium laguerreae]
MRLALMYGGRSVEHDWSIAMYNHFADVLNDAVDATISPAFIYHISRSGDLLRLALDGDRLPNHDEFSTRAETYSLTSLAHILKNDSTFVFSLLQGQDGEDGQIQALAQFYDIPGSFGDKTAAMLSADKFLQGLIVNRLCPELTPIPTIHISQGDLDAGISEALRHLTGPCVLKPNTLGGSFLTECVDDLSEECLRSYSERIAAYDASFLVQQRIFGTEYTCGVLVNRHEVRPLPIARINNPSGFLGYDQKTQKGSYIVEFQKVEDCLQASILSMSCKIAREFGLHTFGRLDFIVDDQRRVYFFEVNVVPGLTAGSIFPKMLAEAGFDLCHIIRLAASNETYQRRREEVRKTETSHIRYGRP